MAGRIRNQNKRPTDEEIVQRVSDVYVLLQDLAAQDTALLEATGYDADDLQALLFELNPSFDPISKDEVARLDQKKPVVCPHCGQEFVPSE